MLGNGRYSTRSSHLRLALPPCFMHRDKGWKCVYCLCAHRSPAASVLPRPLCGQPQEIVRIASSFLYLLPDQSGDLPLTTLCFAIPKLSFRFGAVRVSILLRLRYTLGLARTRTSQVGCRRGSRAGKDQGHDCCPRSRGTTPSFQLGNFFL